MSSEAGPPARRWRVLFGIVGILIGAVGLLNILAERRAADEQQRTLTALADDFRRRDQERRPPRSDTAAVVWDGQTFRAGDPVRIAKWAGTFNPPDTGAATAVHAASGQVGVVIRGEKRESTAYLRIDPNEPIQIVRVRWRSQSWKTTRGDSLQLPEFEATIHVSHLEAISAR